MWEIVYLESVSTTTMVLNRRSVPPLVEHQHTHRYTVLQFSTV